MGSDTGICALCGRVRSLDNLIYAGKEGAKCLDGCDSIDAQEVFESDNEQVTRFVASYCERKKFNPAERSVFLRGLQVGVGLARAIQTDTLNQFTGEY